LVGDALADLGRAAEHLRMVTDRAGVRDDHEQQRRAGGVGLRADVAVGRATDLCRRAPAGGLKRLRELVDGARDVAVDLTADL
jgi:hypothetical protein